MCLNYCPRYEVKQLFDRFENIENYPQYLPVIRISSLLCLSFLEARLKNVAALSIQIGYLNMFSLLRISDQLSPNFLGLSLSRNQKGYINIFMHSRSFDIFIKCKKTKTLPLLSLLPPTTSHLSAIFKTKRNQPEDLIIGHESFEEAEF